MNTLPIELLHRTFSIVDGRLFWRERKRGRPFNRAAGTLHHTGYRQIKFGNKFYLEHRIIFAMTHGRWPSHQTDHENLNKADNSPKNLREATHAQNARNRPLRRDNTSGAKGVYFDKRSGKWIARIGTQGKATYLGCHDDLSLAAFIYECAARKFHGDFART